jgi:hypothetical protein
MRRLRGVGSKTRRELVECLQRLAERFPEAAVEPKQLPAEEVEVPAAGGEAPRIDQLAGLLVPAGRTRETQASAKVVEGLLGLDDGALEAAKAGAWTSQSEVARALGVNPATVSHAIAAACQRWLKTPAMTSLREDMAALLDTQGG